jgi:hypothetical protein
MTTTRLPARFIATLTCALALIGLVAGCAGGSGGSATSVDYEPHEQSGDSGGSGAAPDSEAAPEHQAEDGGEVSERAIITTTDVYVTVDDVGGAVDAMEQLVDEYDGYLESRNESLTGDRPDAWMQARVPADTHDAFVADLDGFGEVTSVESSSEDVTLTKVDLESRISALEASITSLESMLEAATTVSEMLEIEQELSSRQGELQSLESQLEVLEEDVAMSTVTVNFSTEYVAPDDEPKGFFAGLAEGWNNLIESLGRFVQGLGYAIPGLVLLAVILVAAWFLGLRKLWRRIRRPGNRDNGPAGWTPQPGPGNDGPPQAGPHQAGPHQAAPRPATERPHEAEPGAEARDEAPSPQQRLADGLPPLPPTQ